MKITKALTTGIAAVALAAPAAASAARLTAAPSCAARFGSDADPTAMTTVRRALAAFIPVLAALVLASPATADSTDSAYLNGLALHGIVGLPPAGAIDEGRHICRTLDGGYATPMGVATTLTQWFDTYNITLDQAAFWVGDAIGAYCPWHSHDAPGPN